MEETDRPDFVCPNCWGRQEYGGQVKDAMYKEHIDVNNSIKKRSFIQEFVKTNLNGIILKNDNEGKFCPSCNSRY